MIVRCENCQVAFKVNEKLIKNEGSKFRCSKCKHVFMIYPQETFDPQSEVIGETLDSSPAAAPTPAPSPVTPPPRPQPPDTGEYEDSDVEYSAERTLTMVDFSEEAFDPSILSGEQYEDMGSIGEGGMGEVRLAKDTALLRKVAVKVLKNEVTSQAALSYFLREAQITAQLDHPNIVPLYAVKPPQEGEQNVSFVMKLIKGKTLSEIITKARKIYKDNSKAKLPSDLSLRARIEYFLKACEGIIYAHRKEVIHRDLKPANIMVGDFGEVYVMDWGIAKMLKDAPETLFQIQRVAAESAGGTGATDLTRAGSVVGTPSYMSPEQAKALPDVGPSSDIFSLGVILYELVTLMPGRTGDLAKKLKWAEGGYLNEIRHMVKEQKIEPELKAIIHKATAEYPEDRYPTVSALADDVRSYLRGDEVSVLPDNLPKKIWRLMNKHRQWTAMIIMGIVILSAFSTIVSLSREKAALKAARIRETRLTNLQADVSSQAHYIDSHFLRLEDLAANLANVAIYLIEEAPPNNERFYWKSDFNNTEKAPPDHKHAPLYDKAVSIDYPVVARAPGTEKKDVSVLMQRLAPLRYHFRRTLLDSRSGSAHITDLEAARLLTVHGVPIRWVFIGLEVGVMYSYPGKGTYGDDYDPRKRPWYELAANKRGVFWGNPYADIQGLGLVLPCATSLYGKDNDFYGVLGMDVTFSDIIQDNLTRPGAKGVFESFLLDNEGKIVVRSRQQGLKLDKDKASLKLEKFPVKQVVDAVIRSESGLVELHQDDVSRIIVFQRMASLGWYYVEDIESAAIFSD